MQFLDVYQLSVLHFRSQRSCGCSIHSSVSFYELSMSPLGLHMTTRSLVVTCRKTDIKQGTGEGTRYPQLVDIFMIVAPPFQVAFCPWGDAFNMVKFVNKIVPIKVFSLMPEFRTIHWSNDHEPHHLVYYDAP